MCNCWRGAIRVLTWLRTYYYHGAGSAAVPNYIISAYGPTINTLSCMKAIIISTDRSSYDLAFANDYFMHFIQNHVSLWHCAENYFLKLWLRRQMSQLFSVASLSCLSLTGSVGHCLLASVCNSCVEDQLSLLMKFFLLSVLNVTATILWFPSLPSPYFGVVPSPGAPSCLASFTKETCTWKSQRCHHYVQCWRIPVPTGPGQHAVSAAGCLHTIR